MPPPTGQRTPSVRVPSAAGRPHPGDGDQDNQAEPCALSGRRCAAPRPGELARLLRSAWFPLWLAAAIACDGCAAPQPSPPSPKQTSASTCRERVRENGLVPGTRPEHERLDYWLERHDDAELDRPILSPGDIAAYNAAIGRNPGGNPTAQHDLLARPDRAALTKSSEERLAYMRSKLDSGEFVTEGGQPPSPNTLQAFDSSPQLAKRFQLFVTYAPVQIRCGPYPDALFAADEHSGYDRNACSTAHAQEPVQVLGTSKGGMRLVRTRYALGWMPAKAPLVRVPRARQEAFVRGPFAWARERVRFAAGGSVPRFTTVPMAGPNAVWLAAQDGISRRPREQGLLATTRPITRRTLLTTAFAYLGTPYGLGGQDGGRDCSRLTLDLFETFDLALPRHSGLQAKSGSRAFDLPTHMSSEEKLARIDEAASHAVVLLVLPGHIMLYLGRDDAGTPMVLHSLGEYARPCEDGGETVVDVRKTIVSDLALGRGSSRTSLIERVDRMVAFGPEEAGPRASLPSPVKPAACRDKESARIFWSPRQPLVGGTVRAIATVEEDPGNVRLSLWAPDGKRLDVHERVLGGPPYTRWVEAPAERGGHYQAVLGDGDRVIACKRIPVRRYARESEPPPEDGPVWQPRWKWELDTENLWSAFVEQLFDYPPDDGRTWTNLHSLLRDRSRNILYNHLGLNEDERLELQPDCADLPYVLRAYYAWKLNLPYGFRQCSRGRPRKPPRCGDLRTNLAPRAARDPVEAFSRFANRRVRSGVHSASGRTHPDDSDTDFYPVDLTSSTLRPGTSYSDPYGHVMMLSKWFPQGPRGSGQYGILMASEAQPDGTVGRRRFWEGSFLFDPSTVHVGAGFKRFRPLVYDEEADSIRALANSEIRARRGFARYGKGQYNLEKTAFYDHMDGLINPRPLDPGRRMEALVDALEESVMRRVTAVNNGEEFIRSRTGRPIDMPSGYSLFETTGPWEDFSTPARDMRLLISIDTVVGFPKRVARNPQRFVVDGKPPDINGIEARLAETLKARTFEYQRTDGSAFSLSLADVVDRAQAFEMAYNPNDCVEHRWAAPEGSQEAATCRRHAPQAQRKRMHEYRAWFQNRARPPRGTR